MHKLAKYWNIENAKNCKSLKRCCLLEINAPYIQQQSNRKLVTKVTSPLLLWQQWRFKMANILAFNALYLKKNAWLPPFFISENIFLYYNKLYDQKILWSQIKKIYINMVFQSKYIFFGSTEFFLTWSYFNFIKVVQFFISDK